MYAPPLCEKGLMALVDRHFQTRKQAHHDQKASLSNLYTHIDIKHICISAKVSGHYRLPATGISIIAMAQHVRVSPPFILLYTTDIMAYLLCPTTRAPLCWSHAGTKSYMLLDAALHAPLVTQFFERRGDRAWPKEEVL